MHICWNLVIRIQHIECNWERNIFVNENLATMNISKFYEIDYIYLSVYFYEYVILYANIVCV